LDQVRRDVWKAARRSGQTALARELKDTCFAPRKNPDDLATLSKQIGSAPTRTAQPERYM
jgi:hypothetical protein